MNKVLKNWRSFYTNNKFILILFLLSIIFLNKVEDLFHIILINPLFIGLKRSLWVDVILGIITLGSVSNSIKRIKQSFMYSSTYILLAAMGIVFFVYYRWYSGGFYFYRFTVCQDIAYLDVLLLWFSLVPITAFINHLQKKLGRKTTIDHRGFRYDIPISGLQEDDFDRKVLAKVIADKINQTRSNQNSFALGIAAEWGSGKTSFLNLIKNDLSDKHQVVIDFNPWLNYGSQSISKDFFQLLSNHLKPYHSNISSDFDRYAQILLNMNHTRLNALLNPLKSMFVKKRSIQEEFDFINGIIEKLEVQIVVFIDDMDRLYQEEITEVLKLIRNTANFANMIFVVGFDKAYVIRALKNMKFQNPEKYLDKIFQVEIPLPKYEYRLLEQQLLQLIEPELSEIDKKELQSFFCQKNREKGLLVAKKGQFQNMRDINRFSNAFSIAYRVLENNIRLADLFRLEVLRFYYPLFCDWFYKRRNIYLLERVTEERYFINIVKLRTDLHLDQRRKMYELNIDDEALLVIEHILKELFPEDMHAYAANVDKAITYKAIFDRYFYYGH